MCNLNIKTTDKKGIIELILNYRKNKNFIEGIKFIKDQLKIDDDTIYLFYLADFYYSLNDYSLSEEYLIQFLHRNPKDYKGTILKAKLLMKREKYKKALDLLLPLTNSGNKNFSPHLYTGICYLKLNKFENSIEHIKKFIKFTSGHSGFAYYYLSTAYYKKKDLPNSVKYMEKAYNITRADFYYQRLIKYKLEALPESEREKELMKILKIKEKSNNPELHILLGETLLKQKKYDDAVDSFYQAVMSNQKNNFYKERYIYACDKAGKYDIVYDIAKNIIDSAPFKVWLQVLFTRACVKLKKIEEGLEFYYALLNRTKMNIIGKQIKELKKHLKP